MPNINTPAELVEEFKKSGEFDRLRRELLAQFQISPGAPHFSHRVEEIVTSKLSKDERIQDMSEVMAVKELTQEVDRYPVVGRALSEMDYLRSREYRGHIKELLRRMLKGEGSDQALRMDGSTLPENKQAHQVNPAAGDSTKAAGPGHSALTSPQHDTKDGDGKEESSDEDMESESEDSAMEESPVEPPQPLPEK